MEKKLRRDFKERQKIKEEAKLLGKEYMDADEAGKVLIKEKRNSLKSF